MNLNLGIEPRDEYLSLELAKGARMLLEGQMLVKKGETVLITGDTSSDRRVMEAIAQAAYAMDAVPVVLYYHTMPNACTEPPAPVSAAAQASDVWVELSYAYVHAFSGLSEGSCQRCSLYLPDWYGRGNDGQVRFPCGL